MPDRSKDRIVMEDVRILFPNFQGKEEPGFNREGDRNFCVALPEDVAVRMANDGWNVKMLKAREEGDIPQAYLKVTVSYKVRPPQVYVVTSRGRTLIGEDTISMLDSVEYKMVDLIINPYNYNVNGSTGITAYLESLYVTIVEDPLALKYAQMDESR